MDTTSLLKELVSIPSVTSDVPSVNKCVDRVRAEAEALGLHVFDETFEEGRRALFVSTVPEKVVDLVLVAHMDVVPAASPSQFEPRQVGDKLYGRGSDDCKANVVCSLLALAEMARDPSAHCTAGALFASDEETGGLTTLGLTQRGYLARKAYVVLDAHSNYDIVVAQKGILELLLTAHGKGGHASEPWAFDNPIYKLANGLLLLRDHVEEAWSNDDGQKQWHPSFAPCMLRSGDAANQIPDTASATINIRLTENEKASDVIEMIRSMTGFDVSVIAESPCVAFDSSAPALSLLQESIRFRFPKANVGFVRMNGATDARHLASVGVPIAMTGTAGGCCHSANEFAVLSSIEDYAAICVDYAKRLKAL